MIISILNWNGWQDTLECLESVLGLDYPNFLVVVVDNGSWDRSAERIECWARDRLSPGCVLAQYTPEAALAGGSPCVEGSLDPAPSSSRMVLIRGEENLGFTGGHNLAISYALRRSVSPGYVLTLNNDTTLRGDCLRVLVLAARASGAGVTEGSVSRGALGGFLPPWAFDPREGFPRRGSQRTPADEGYAEVTAVRGVAMLIERTMLDALASRSGDYLDRRFFMYMEDIMLSRRARQVGRTCVHAGGAIIHHKGARSSGGRFNPLEYYYCQRNGLLLWREAPLARRVVHCGKSLAQVPARAAKALVCGRPESALAMLAGAIDGVTGVTGKWKHHDRLARARR